MLVSAHGLGKTDARTWLPIRKPTDARRIGSGPAARRSIDGREIKCAERGGAILALFTTSNYPLMALIEDIDLGKIGLPELQRYFIRSWRSSLLSPGSSLLGAAVPGLRNR